MPKLSPGDEPDLKAESGRMAIGESGEEEGERSSLVAESTVDIVVVGEELFEEAVEMLSWLWWLGCKYPEIADDVRVAFE